MSSESDAEVHYLEEILFMPDDHAHRGWGSFKAAVFSHLEDFVDEYYDLSMILMVLPLITLAELWRDDPFRTLDKALTITAIDSHICCVYEVFANILPLVLFIVGATPKPCSEPVKRKVYCGPSIIDIFPQEIIDNIIDHLAPDVGHYHQICGRKHDKFDRRQFARAFSSYSLVCRAFARRSQTHIFSTLAIRSSAVMDIHRMDFFETDPIRGARLRSMVQFFAENPHLSRCIRHLQIDPHPQAFVDPDSDERIQMQAFLSDLKSTDVQVRSLCLGFQCWAVRPIDDLAALLLPSSLLSNVTSLHIDEVFKFPPSFVSMFPSLHSLSLSNFQTSNNHALQNSASPNGHAVPKLRSLVLQYTSYEFLHIMGMVRNDRDRYFASNVAFLDLSQLTHCDLVWTGDDDQSIASSTLLKTYGSAITHFTYQFRCMPSVPDNAFVNLEHLPALQELTVVFEPIWGISRMTAIGRLEPTRPSRAVRSSGTSIDFLCWFLGNVCSQAPLRMLNILCPSMIFSGRDTDSAKLFLGLEWQLVDAEICRIYDNIAMQNLCADSNLMINLTFSIPLQFPGGVHYESGVETNREERLQWIATTKRKWQRAMRSRFRKQFPLIAQRPGINLNIFYTFEGYVC